LSSEERGASGGSYADSAREVLQAVLGEGGAQTVLHYTGEPDPSTFEANLRKVLGVGADLILGRMRKP